MNTLTIVLLVILVMLIIACVVLYFLGKRAEKKQAEQQKQLDAVAQTVSMLIIDKGKLRLKDAGLPPIVLEKTPKYLRRSKVPVVKAKVGPKVMTLMCDSQIFPLIPVKKEVKATVSAVSYTHLDVYKRQAIFCQVMAAARGSSPFSLAMVARVRRLGR